MSFSIAERFMMARDEHKASTFLAKLPTDYEWASIFAPINFSDGSSAHPVGMDRMLSEKEFTKAVARYCRRHGHYASFVRTNTETRACAVREWRLDYPEAV